MRIVMVTMSKSLYFVEIIYRYWLTEDEARISKHYCHHSTPGTLFKQQQPKISSEQQPPPFSPSSPYRYIC